MTSGKSRPAIGWHHRSKALRRSFERALTSRRTRAAVLELQRDYHGAQLTQADQRALDVLVVARLTELGRSGEG